MAEDQYHKFLESKRFTVQPSGFEPTQAAQREASKPKQTSLGNLTAPEDSAPTEQEAP